MYTTQTSIEAEIPAPKLNDALDDDRDGQADPGILTQIITNASREIDGLLAGRYATPFDDPAPATVQQAAFIFTCEAIYNRREVTNEKNPYTKRATDIRDILKKIASGEMPLDTTLTPAIESAYDPGVRNPGRIVP
jgi:phage gp36-like protein